MANLLTHIAREFKLDALTAFRKRWHAAKQAVSHSRALWTLTESGGRLRVGAFPWRLADPPEERPGVEVSLRLRPTIRPGIGLTLPPSRNHDSDAYLYGALPFFGQVEVWIAWPERFRNKNRQKARTYEVRVPDFADDTTENEKLLWGLVHNAKNTEPVARPLWSVVMKSVGCGSTYAQRLCRRFGCDPDEAVPGLMDDSGSCSVCGNTTCPECETVSDADYCRECFVICEVCENKVPREHVLVTSRDGEEDRYLCVLRCAPKAEAVPAAAPPPTFSCGCTDEKKCAEHAPKEDPLYKAVCDIIRHAVLTGTDTTHGFEVNIPDAGVARMSLHVQRVDPPTPDHLIESVCCARCGVNESPDKAVQGPHGEVFCSDACATEALCGG